MPLTPIKDVTLRDGSVLHIHLGLRGLAKIQSMLADLLSPSEFPDLDIVYSRGSENIARLVGALRPLHPYLRGAPQGLPFEWSVKTIQNGLNFTLMTTLGALDLFGEIVGGGGYEQLLPETIKIEVAGVESLCLSLKSLIEVKRAAGRPKDLEAIAELEEILEEKDRETGPETV